MRRSPIAASVLLAALFGTVLSVAGAYAIGTRAAEHSARPVELGVVAQPFSTVAATPDNRAPSRALPLATFAAIVGLLSACAFSNVTRRRALVATTQRWSLVRLRGPPLSS